MYKLVGFKKIEFKKDGNLIKGVRIYFVDDSSKNNTFGVCPDSVFISETLLNQSGLINAFVDDSYIGFNIRLFYNKYGKIQDIDINV